MILRDLVRGGFTTRQARTLVTAGLAVDVDTAAPAGVAVIRKFPFAFNTPGLLTGHAVYTPTVGDVLLDAWIEVVTTWDGTTPRSDIGSFVGTNLGIFANADPTDFQAAQLGSADSGYAGDGYIYATDLTLSLVESIGVTPKASAYRAAPGRFTLAHPLKVVVSQDGTSTGADPGSTQGAAVLYLVTATPA